MDLPPLHFYPLFTALLLPFTFLATYLVAIGLNHTEVDWPYISDTSASPPESCIFSQLVNVGALFLGIVVYIRYKQVHEFYRSHHTSRQAVLLNSLSRWVGWTGALGISIVANFPESQVKSVHLVGAVMAFGIGALYLWTQVYSSFILCPLTHGEPLKWARVILSCICTVGFFLMMVTMEIASSEFHGKDKTKWNPEDGGWNLHLVSTVSEWVVALALNAFLLTFVPEFKKVTLDSPKICIRINQASLPFGNEDSEFRTSYAESITSTEEFTNASIRA